MASPAAPLITLVTPTYNQARFLPHTIDSVLAQDYPRIEYLVLDDGSTDETREILKHYKRGLSWSSRENRGQTATINEGWKAAQGDIVGWLNSDDTLYPCAITAVVRYFQDHEDVSIVFGDTMYTDVDGKLLFRMSAGAFDYERFVVDCQNPIPQPSAFIRRSVVEDVGLLDPYYHYFMDWDYWLRAGIRHRIVYFPELLSTYRLHPESKTVARTAEFATELRRMYESYFALPHVPERLRGLRSRSMANMWFTTGGYFVRGGRGAAAIAAGFRALAAYPALLTDPGMLHKLAYCLLGWTWLYAKARKAYRAPGERAA